MNVRLGTLTCGLLAVSLVTAGCTRSQPEASPAEPVTFDAPAGHLELLFSEATLDEPTENFLILGAVPLADGSLAVLYDVAYPQAGSDVSGYGDPRLMTLADGRLTPIELPDVDGVPVDSAALPLASSPEGELYLWDYPAERLLRRTATGHLSVIAQIDANAGCGPQGAAVGPVGDLYLLTADTILRIGEDGEAARIAGVEPDPSFPGDCPEIALGPLPRPATSAALPYLSAIAVGNDGTVYVTSMQSLLAVSDGQLRLVADPGTVGENGRPLIFHSGSFLTSVGIDVDGAVLVGDSGRQRILRITESSASVLVTSASSIVPGSVGRFPEADLLFVRGGGESLYVLGR